MKVIIIGRGQTNDILIDDDRVSHNHLQIVQDDYGNCSVVDLGSANGTFVNGQRITGERRLQANDIVKIGNTTLPWQSYLNSKPKSKRAIWYIAAAVALALFVGGSFFIAAKVIYNKKQEKIEAENRAKTEKFQQETEKREAEKKQLQDEADELLRKALISQSDKDKSLAEKAQQIANTAKNEAEKAKVEAEKAKNEQRKAENEKNKALIAKREAEAARKRAEAAEQQMQEKAKQDSIEKVQAGKTTKERSEDLKQHVQTETESNDVQKSDYQENMKKNLDDLSKNFTDDDFKNICDILKYNIKKGKSAEDVLNENFNAAIAKIKPGDTSGEWQHIIIEVNKYKKTLK